MGGNNGNPQAPQQSMAQQASSMPNGQSYTPDSQTGQMISNYRAMKDSGIFNTPYQNAMQKHPVLMGLANGMQAFGQGITHQPFYTGNQENQASLQNTQEQGINAINTLPAQLRMMMAMQGMYNQPGGVQPPTNVPGIPSVQMPSVITTPGGGMPSNPMATQMAAAKAAGYSDAEIQAYLAGKK